MPSDEAMSGEQLRILKGMAPEQRWTAARQLYWTMRRHKAACLKSRHAEWSDARIQEEVRDCFLYARS